MATMSSQPEINVSRLVAARVGRERLERGWSQREMAAEMTAAGCCSMFPSTIGRIEHTEAPRHIQLDELVIFAHVFGVQPWDLTRPFDPVEFARREVSRAKALLDVARETAAGRPDSTA